MKRGPVIAEPFTDHGGNVHAFVLPASLSPADRQRAAMLLAAQAGVRDLRESMKRTKPDPLSGERRSVTIGVEDVAPGSGAPGGGEIKIDFKTARKLISPLLDVIGDEIAALGAWQDE